MENTVVGASPEIDEEINRALSTLKKRRYQATVQEDSSGQHAITFKLGETEQTMRFTDNEWRQKGAIEKKIIDKLEI